ncbi:hypothetical protein K040078D81_33370 [Blautia hominis]|uniref:Threonine/Serine exporter ThrE domain-containing protein n=1 Tax=Blautia hominis TaxID=2025493 RepID=A0ABQ0BCM8_9FIRM
MIVIQGAAQFVAAFLGTVAFSVLFSVPREQYPLCGTIGGFGWLICWICTNPFHMSAVTGSFIATVFIVTASRIGSTIRKCPVTLFLIAGIFPLVPGIGIYRTLYYTLMQESTQSLYYGRQTLGIALAMVLGIVFVFEIPQKTINRIFRKKHHGKN